MGSKEGTLESVTNLGYVQNGKKKADAIGWGYILMFVSMINKKSVYNIVDENPWRTRQKGLQNILRS